MLFHLFCLDRPWKRASCAVGLRWYLFRVASCLNKALWTWNEQSERPGIDSVESYRCSVKDTTDTPLKSGEHKFNSESIFGHITLILLGNWQENGQLKPA
jgi:hypothetical protein